MRFDAIEKRLEDGSNDFKYHGQKQETTDRKVAVIEERMDGLIQSMNTLTKGIWGLVTTIGLSFLGFFFWYVQSLGR